MGYFTPPFSLKVVPADSQEDGIRAALFAMTVSDASFYPDDTTIHRMMLRLVDTGNRLVAHWSDYLPVYSQYPSEYVLKCFLYEIRNLRKSRQQDN